ncbi:hypothetical protein [Oceanirhabdus seepicola]|uniref:Uncharacterized protein n=1 Tax=Oceanirhabdus seepicola TaxID=2828781 RepID=A0A9J6P842_9CLOT|nr:hypothetical protein [Oceanirhabdus seepicola]MCM1992073.1 hypothetical protein [Oceanirhabdus seepicola]
MNSAFIPLYLNSALMSNLFTVVGNIDLSSDVSVQSISTKTQQNTTYTVPMSELTRDLTGRFIQGEVKFNISNELQLEKTAIEITALIKLRKVLKSKSFLTLMRSPLDIQNVREKEYIEFQGIIDHNPHLRYIEKMVEYIEIDNLIDGIKSIESLEDEKKLDLQMKKINFKKELLGDLKDKIKQHKEERCEYLITEGLYGSKLRAIIPVEDKHLLDNIEHMMACRVTVLGKVIKVGTIGELGLSDRKKNYLKHVDKIIVNELANMEKSRSSKNMKKNDDLNPYDDDDDDDDLNPYDDDDDLKKNDPVILILPLSISM